MSEEHFRRSPQTTAVEIYGHTYNIRSEGGSAHILDLANLLDQRMREISAQTLIVESVKIAILAALNFSDELHRLKGTCRQQELKIESMISECSEVLDQALSSGKAPVQEPSPRARPSNAGAKVEVSRQELNGHATGGVKKRLTDRIGQPLLLPLDDRLNA